MTIRTLNHENFLKVFQEYFNITVGKARINQYQGNNHISIYYDNEDYSSADDIRIMAMDFSFKLETIMLSVRIPLDSNFEKEKGLVLDNPTIKKHVEKAKCYYPVFKRVAAGYDPEGNSKLYFIIKCNISQLITKDGNIIYQIDNESYQFEAAFNIQANGNSSNCDDFVAYVDKYLDKYFSKNNVDIEGIDYKRKLELYHMITI